MYFWDYIRPRFFPHFFCPLVRLVAFSTMDSVCAHPWIFYTFFLLREMVVREDCAHMITRETKYSKSVFVYLCVRARARVQLSVCKKKIIIKKTARE